MLTYDEGSFRFQCKHADSALRLQREVGGFLLVEGDRWVVADEAQALELRTADQLRALAEQGFNEIRTTTTWPEGYFESFGPSDIDLPEGPGPDQVQALLEGLRLHRADWEALAQSLASKDPETLTLLKILSLSQQDFENGRVRSLKETFEWIRAASATPEVMRVNAEAWEALQEALDAPPRPMPRMKSLLEGKSPVHGRTKN